ncbi:MAG TPA: transcriptional repressor [bacterium]|nr:transcriptional repressor [bacterium]
MMKENWIIDILRSKGFKVTPQRIALIDTTSKAGHASVEQIYKSMKDGFPAISLTTIYKIIGIFLHNEIIKEIHIAGKKKIYEIKKSPHAHHVCAVCGRISDIYIDTKDLVGQIKSKGYETTSPAIYCYGICPDCRK